MAAYALRRLALIPPLLVGVSLLLFVLTHLVPADPAKLNWKLTGAKFSAGYGT